MHREMDYKSEKFNGILFGGFAVASLSLNSLTPESTRPAPLVSSLLYGVGASPTSPVFRLLLWALHVYCHVRSKPQTGLILPRLRESNNLLQAVHSGIIVSTCIHIEKD
uniref:Uncharacterized protein n=1 Tax=Arundo donax TaxID=35708 RepID=A0A0A8YN86_ARUDO